MKAIVRTIEMQRTKVTVATAEMPQMKAIVRTVEMQRMRVIAATTEMQRTKVTVATVEMSQIKAILQTAKIAEIKNKGSYLESMCHRSVKLRWFFFFDFLLFLEKCVVLWFCFEDSIVLIRFKKEMEAK